MSDQGRYRRRGQLAAVALSTLILATGPKRVLADDAELRRQVTLLASDEYAQREAATLALVRAGAAAVPLVAEAAKSGDREARYRGMIVLDRLARQSEPSARKTVRKALTELARSDDVRIAQLAGDLLRKLGEEAAWRLQQSGGNLGWKDGRLWSVSFAHRTVDDAVLAPIDDVEPVQLNLTRTSVTDATLARIADQTQLELLNLMSTKVTDEGMKHLVGLTAMTTFSVERTEVTDAGLEHLRGLTRLKTLYLGGSKIAGPGLKHVEHLPVEYLSFAFSPVDDSVVEHVVRLKSLKTLGLDDTKVTDACLPRLVALEKLEVLWLDNCAVTDAGVADLVRLKQLKTVHAQNTKISAKGFAELKAGLAGVQINGSAVD